MMPITSPRLTSKETSSRAQKRSEFRVSSSDFRVPPLLPLRLNAERTRRSGLVAASVITSRRALYDSRSPRRYCLLRPSHLIAISLMLKYSRQVANDQSGDRSPHSKTFKPHPQIPAPCAGSNRARRSESPLLRQTKPRASRRVVASLTAPSEIRQPPPPSGSVHTARASVRGQSNSNRRPVSQTTKTESGS